MRSEMDAMLFGLYLLIHMYIIVMQFVKDIHSAQVLSYSMWQNVGHSQQQRLPLRLSIITHRYIITHHAFEQSTTGYNEGDERSVAMI